MPRLLIETLCMGGVLGYLAVYILRGGNLTEMIPQMTAFAFAATRLLPSVNRINGHVTNIAFFQPSLDCVYEMWISAIILSMENTRTGTMTMRRRFR